MAETQGPPALPILIQVSKLDVQIAVLNAQKKKLDADLAARRQVIAGHETKKQARTKLLAERRSLSDREEKSVKHERERINERRVALQTLNNYKLQQAAEKEIEFVAKQIGQREDLLLGLMREVEVMEKELADLNGVIQGLQGELAALEAESAATIKGIDEQLTDLNQRRAAQASELGNPSVLTVYNRVRDRFPSNPVVEIVNRDSCSGCFMKLGPQVIVQVSRQDMVKCPGCGRILFLAAEKQE